MTDRLSDPPAAGTGPLLLLLHGHGSTPAGVEPIARALARRTGSTPWCPAGPCRVAPHDGHEPDGGSRAWWAGDADGPDSATVDELVAILARHGGDVRIAGFSQGAATALAVASAYTTAVPGGRPRVIVVAGFLPGDGAVPAGTDVLVVHGEADEVVDPFHGDLVARRCRRNGCEVTEVRHGGGHHWDDAVTATVAEWLGR